MSRYWLMQEALARERTGQRRQTREASLYQQIPDKEFVDCFRVTPELFENLCSEVVPLLPPNQNSRGIDPTLKILTALKFFGRGDYQGGVGRDQSIPMSQQAVSKCLKQVTLVLNDAQLVRRHVRFPQNQAERAVIKTGCDAENQILNVDASYGGATHDSFIWQNSAIREHFENLCSTGERAVLLGDSGYPLREYILSPVDGATEDSPEGRYNAVQKKARSTIERTFGILKGRWRCLLAARELYYDPEVVGKMAIACSVLHNMCLAARLEPIELEPNEVALENEIQLATQSTNRASSSTEALRRGREARALLIRAMFAE